MTNKADEMYKKPHQECEYSVDQLKELHKCSIDPLYFIRNYIKILHPKNGITLFKTFPYQDRVLKSMINNRFLMLLQPRQTGKSTLIAAYLLWYACFNKDKVILVASNKNSNAMEIMAKIILAYEELPVWLKPGVKYATKHSLDFDNQSRIISQATTESTGRGLAISLLMLDELAFVPKRIQEEMWTSLAPTLSTGGGCIISSTPNGDDDLFAQLWYGAQMGTNGFYGEEVLWDEHPDRDEEFKNEMLAKIGPVKWKQEYECQMVSSDALLISSLVLQQMKHKEPTHTDMGFNFWKPFRADKTYYVSVDIAGGTGQDFSVIQVFEMPTMEQVAEFRRNDFSVNKLYPMIKWILEKIYDEATSKTNGRQQPEIYWSYENNGVGMGITTLYMNDETFPEYANLISEPGKSSGLNTNTKSKLLVCMELKNLIERKKSGLTINSKFLLAELKNFVSKGKSYEAKVGCTDDCVSATLVMCRMLQISASYDEQVFDSLYSTEVDSDDFGEGPMPMIM